MSLKTPVLHMLCGKIAAGKSTLAAELASEPDTVLLSEDDWLSTLFGDQMQTIPDYVRCSAKLRQVMGPHVVQLLNAGLSVVLDFPANRIDNRAWMRGLLEQTKADNRLHVLTIPEDARRARFNARNAQGDHPFSVTDEQYEAMSVYFQEPSEDEGFTLVQHHATA